VLLFDEPVNGLDPEGILWIRRFMQELAAAGRTVLVSSHLLSEMSLTAEDLVVIGRGRLIAQCTTAEFIQRAGEAAVRVRSPQLVEFSQILAKAGASVARPDHESLLVSGMDGASIGELAASHGVVLHELSPQAGSLEEAFLQITRDSVEYHTRSADS
jgi:ABC-2 type transport system ATP-binding protein